MQSVAHTTPQTFRLHWTASSGKVQYRYFTTLRQMRGYMKSQCQCFTALLSMSLFNKNKYEAFVLIANKIVTESELRSHLVFLKDRKVV